MMLWCLGWPELPPDIYLPENSQAEQKCPACGGNDGDMPCAYPGEHEQQPGCLRAAYSRGQTLKGNEMTSICENEHCAYHRPLPVKDAGAPYVDAVEDGERVRVDRYLYRSRDGKRDFFLCDVCHAAVQMVVTPNAADAASKALRRAWQLGQTYWQQADSEYTSQHRKADETQAKFQALVDEARAAILDVDVTGASGAFAAKRPCGQKGSAS